MERLKDLAFADLYLGSDFADVKGMLGASASSKPLAPEFREDADRLRAQCLAAFDQHEEPEFREQYDGIWYRVTIMSNMRHQAVLFLRRIAGEVRDFIELGLPDPFVNWFMTPSLTGLLLFAGATGAGKSTTAASAFVHRMKHLGSVGLTVEDPPEFTLEGVHGDGRCLAQVQASRRFGNYEEQLKRSMRTGADLLFIAEIRDVHTAAEAIKHANNGLLVLATVHARTVEEAIDRTLFLAGGDGARRLLAMGLAGVVYQRLDRQGPMPQAIFTTLALQGKAEAGMRAKIRDNQVHQLQQDIDSQAGSTLWH